MVVSTPDKALLRLLWDSVKHNGSFDAVAFSEWAERVRELERAGIPVYEIDGSLDAVVAAVRRDAEVLESLGFVETSEDGGGACLTLLGQLHAETLEYPAWAVPLIEGAGKGVNTRITHH